MREGLFIPLSQAIASGLFIALAGWGFAAELWFVALFGTAALAAWLFQIRRWYQYQYPVEQQPQVISQQYTQALQLNVTYNSQSSYPSAEFLEMIGVTEHQFIAWSSAIASGASLGENHWTGKGNLFSKPVYLRLRSKMIEAKIVRPAGRHHAQGYELTSKGSAVFGEVATRSASPGWTLPPQFFGAALGLRARERERAEIIEG